MCVYFPLKMRLEKAAKFANFWVGQVQKDGALRPLLLPPHGRTADHKSRGTENLVVGWWCAGLGFGHLFLWVMLSIVINGV